MRKYILLLIPLLLLGCSAGLVKQGQKMEEAKQYDQAIELYYQEIATNPTNLNAWRQLGIAFYKSGDLVKAEDALKKADRSDAATHLYLGLVLEQNGNFDHAIKSYAAALRLNPSGQSEMMIRAHLDQLIQTKLNREITTALKNEELIETASIPQNTIAVTDFDGSNLDPKIAPIAAGLAEMTAADLAKVESLRVVERLKIEYLLKELKLGASGLTDPTQATRVGRLLGSSRLVTGSAISLGQNGIRIDGVVIGTSDNSVSMANPQEGELTSLFKVQKSFVFDIIENMGIQLTTAERDAIQKVPTESHLAFMAYCRGLDYRSRGMFGPAQQEFQEALSFDQSFSEAGQQMTAVSNSQARMQVGDVSTQQLELVAKAEVAAVSQQTSSGLSTILINSGLVRQGQTNSTANNDPEVNEEPELPQTGTVVITGDLDGN